MRRGRRFMVGTTTLLCAVLGVVLVAGAAKESNGETVRTAAVPVASQAAKAFGLNGTADEDPLRGATPRYLADLRANTLRWAVQWSEVEPSPGQRTWTGSGPGRGQAPDYDALYQAALAAGVRPILILMNAPTWAQDPGSACEDVPGEFECQMPPADQHLPAWRDFARAVAGRYPLARAIEVWNEPGSKTFFQTGANPDRYAELLCAAADGVRATGPDVPPVLFGGLNRAGDVDAGGDMDAGRFLTRAYDRLGERRCFDAISVHPYSHGVDPAAAGSGFNALLDAVRSVRDARDPGRRLWITEYGNSTYRPSPLIRTPNAPATIAQQEQWTMAAYRAAMAMSDVDAFLVHRLADQERHGRSVYAAHFGLVYADGRPKPAFDALRNERAALPVPAPVCQEPQTIARSARRARRGTTARRSPAGRARSAQRRRRPARRARGSLGIRVGKGTARKAPRTTRCPR